MKNLHLLQETFYSLPIDHHTDEVIGYTSIDKHFYYGVSRNGILFALDMLTGEITKQINLFDYEGCISSVDAKILSIQYVSELESLCIVTDLGDILTFKVFSDEVRL